MTANRWPRQGEIWYVYTPGQPEDPHQPRPALIVSENVRNFHSDDITAIPIFTTGRVGPTRLLLSVGEGGIDHDSVLFCEEITTIAKDFLHRGPLGGSVSAEVMRQVILAVRRALGEVTPGV